MDGSFPLRVSGLGELEVPGKSLHQLTFVPYSDPSARGFE